MLPAVYDRIVYGLEYQQRILGVVIGSHDRRIEAGTVAGVAGSPDLLYLCQERVFVAVDGQ